MPKHDILIPGPFGCFCDLSCGTIINLHHPLCCYVNPITKLLTITNEQVISCWSCKTKCIIVCSGVCGVCKRDEFRDDEQQQNSIPGVLNKVACAVQQ